MLKRTFSRLSILILLIAAATSCSKKAGEYTAVIPADAVVVSFNMNSLADKAGIKGAEAESVKQTIMDAFRGGANSSSIAQMEKIINDPSESGIAVDDRIYFFHAPGIVEGALTARVSNQKNLRNLIDTFTKEGGATALSNEGGYEYTVLGGSLALAFNENTALILPRDYPGQDEQIKQVINQLMKQPAEKSIRSKKGFEKMVEKKGEMAFWIPLSSLPDASDLQKGLSIPQDLNLEDVALYGDLSFLKGKVSLETEYYTDSKEAKEMLDKQAKAMGSLTNAHLKNFPSSTLGFISLSLNGEESYKLLMENEEFRRNFAGEMSEEMEKLFKTFKGDITIGLTGVSLDRRFNPTPSFLALASIKDKAATKQLEAMIDEFGSDLQITKRGEGDYKLSADMEILLGHRDNNFYMTNDASLLVNLDKGKDKNMNDASFASHAKGKGMYALVNMDAILEMPLLKLAVGMGGEEAQLYYQLVSLCEYMELYTDKNNKITFNLQLKDKDTNSLKQISDFARGFVGI